MKILKPTIVITISALMMSPLISHANPTNKVKGENHVRVNYADLNIDNPAGVKTLYARLRNASKEVCGNSDSRFSAGSVRQYQLQKQCFEETLSRSVEAIDNAQLKKLHQS